MKRNKRYLTIDIPHPNPILNVFFNPFYIFVTKIKIFTDFFYCLNIKFTKKTKLRVTCFVVVHKLIPFQWNDSLSLAQTHLHTCTTILLFIIGYRFGTFDYYTKGRGGIRVHLLNQLFSNFSLFYKEKLIFMEN